MGKVRKLSLREIADWQLSEKHQLSEKDKVKVCIPSLQRGAVWKPEQVELLWDSLLRGFPIGSFIICPHLQTQNNVKAKYGKCENPTHHLLDGQQRSNAITLGFVDPFIKENVYEAIWLDINPQISDSSTRSFLFRVTTESHPWGYKKDESKDSIQKNFILNTGDIRKALVRFGWREDELVPKKQGRPSVGYSWPYEANLPIPFAWLLEAVNATSDEEEFWVKIKSKFDSYSIVRPEYYKNFNEALAKYIEDTDLTSLSVKKKIYSKAKQSLESELVLIEVPNSVIAEETHQEINDGKKIKNYNEEASEPENISNIEHLFDRLNSKGTPLSPHDRIYSMIKAYWPVFEEKITELKEKGLLHLPDAEFVNLIIRAAIK